jgi:hypothetical protein
MFQLNFYQVAIPYFTVIPLSQFLEIMIKEKPPGDHTGVKLRQTMKYMKIRRIIGFVMSLLVICGSILAIFIIAANNTPEEDFAWKADFIKSTIQDFIITPVLFLAIQYVLYKVTLTNLFRSSKPRTRNFFKRYFLNSKLAGLFESQRENSSSRITNIPLAKNVLPGVKSPKISRPKMSIDLTNKTFNKIDLNESALEPINSPGKKVRRVPFSLNLKSAEN